MTKARFSLSEAPATGLGKLLSEGRFKVPSHQRNYTWSEDEVRQLLDDLESAIQRRDEYYFVGLMVFLATDDYFVVLDGQQRLATAVIILSAIAAWLQPFEKYADSARAIKSDFLGRPELGESEVQPRVTLNAYNNPVFQDYAIRGRPLKDAKAALASASRHHPDTTLLKAIILCHARVEEIVTRSADAETAARYLIDFVKFLRDHTVVVRLTVRDEASAFRIFETLNDRGLELSAMDLVKNYLFSLAVSESDPYLREMESRWAQMIATLQNQPADDFLKVFWTSRRGRVQAADLYDDIKKYTDTHKTAENLSIDMLTASEQYAALENPDDAVWGPPMPSAAREGIKALKTIGFKQVRSVILAALVRFSPQDVERLLRFLEIVIVRYQLVGGGRTGRIEISCAGLAKKIYSEEIVKISQVVSELSDVWVSDAEFEKQFAVVETSNPKAQYLLRRLEAEIRRRQDGRMSGEETLASGLTVEHILPKKPSNQWAEVIRADPSIVDDCGQRLGNLCLLAKVNKDLGAAGWDRKKETYTKSKIRITSELSGYDGWNREAIERRQAALAKTAIAVWTFQ